MIRVIVAEAPLPDLRRTFDLTAGKGLSVADIVVQALPRLAEGDAPRVRVTIGGAREAHVVPHGLWRAVRPKSGAVVCVRFVAGDPISIGLALFNPLISLGFSINSAFAIAGFASSTLVSAGISFVGAALAVSLIPVPPKPHQLPDPEELYQLDGWANQANPGEAIPFPVGRIRMAPLFAARPYSEIIDGDQYIYGLFLWGHGRLDISDLRIKDTALAEFGDVVVNTREGTPEDAPLDLIREQVIEDRQAITLTHPDPDPVRITWTSPRATDRIRLIFQLPAGLFYVEDDGRLKYNEVQVSVRQRLVGTTEWTTVQNVFIKAASVSGFFRQIEWRPPVRGQWEIEVYRISGKGNQQHTDTVVWATATGIRERAPIAYDGPLALTEVRIKASALASGTLDAFNGVVQRYAPVWNGTEWVDALTRNPASSALAVLQSKAGAYPVGPEALYLDEFADLFDHCAATGLKFDRILSGETTLGEALHSVLSGGRATWRRDGQGWGVIIDRAQDVVTDTVGPINASSIRWSRSYLRKPDAFRVSFRDETNGWEQTERVIPWPEFEGVPRTFEDLALEGKTDPDEIWIEARRRQYELNLRPDTFTCIQSGAVRHATRGDAVGLSCDIMDEVQVAARVRRVEGRLVILDAPVRMLNGSSYALKWQLYDAEDTVGDTVQAGVETKPGEGPALLLTDGAETPPVGAQVYFGQASRITFACRLTSLEPAQDVAYRLTLQNDAPELDALAAAEVPPEWTSLAGEEVITAGTPEVPLIGTITLEVAEYDYSGVPVAEVAVPVGMPLTNRVSIERIEVSHRVIGAPGYAVTDINGNGGAASLDHPLGATIELFAVAVSVFGDPSAATAVESFAVTGTVTLPTVLELDGISVSGGLGHAQITLPTAADTAEIQLFRAPSGAALDTDTHRIGSPRGVPGGSSVTLIDGDTTRSEMISGGDMASPGDWTTSGVSIAAGVASHSTGSAGWIAQDLPLVVGSTYRGAVSVSGLSAGTLRIRFNGGSVVNVPLLDAADGDGTHLFALTAATGNDRLEIVWSSDCPADLHSITLYAASSSAAPQGLWDYYVAPINSDKIANIPAGPAPARII